MMIAILQSIMIMAILIAEMDNDNTNISVINSNGGSNNSGNNDINNADKVNSMTSSKMNWITGI